MEDPRNEKKNRFMSHQHTPLLQLLRSLPEAQISHLPLFSPPEAFLFIRLTRGMRSSSFSGRTKSEKTTRAEVNLAELGLLRYFSVKHIIFEATDRNFDSHFICRET